MIPGGLPPLNVSTSSSAQSGNSGDTFFGSVEGGGGFDWLGRVVVPVGVSVVAGLVLFVFSRSAK